MSEQIPIVEAFRVMTANKSLSEEELHDLIRDGIHAALARRFDGPVDAEIEVQPDGDKTADQQLMNGPQLGGEGLSQDEIDSLFD